MHVVVYVHSLLSIFSLGCLLTIAVSASAQTTTSSGAQPAEPPALTWSFGAGYDATWVRDLARTGRSSDGSPTPWEGRGLAAIVQHDRSTSGRLHHFEASFEQAGSFVYRTPLRKISRPAGDDSLRVGGQYEYRRYMLENVGMSGLDAGLGFEGGTEMYAYARNLDPAIEIRVRRTDLTTGLVAAARLRRWRALQIQLAWVNGLAIGRSTTRHSSADQPVVRAWGGGWLTDFRVRADIRVSDSATVFVTYLGTGRGRLSSHDSIAYGRRNVLFGVSHGR